MNRRIISLAVILPLAELSIAALILTVPALLVFLNLQTLAHGTGVAHLQFGQFSQTIPRSDFLSFATQSSASQNSHLLCALNMPGMIFEVLVSLPTSWPASYHPAGLSLDCWRSVVMPLFCLPAWLLAGCGMDSLLGWRKPHWSIMLMGSVVCLLFSSVFLLGIAEEHFSFGQNDDWFIFCGLALWSLLFGTLPAAWIRQWRNRRNLATRVKTGIGA